MLKTEWKPKDEIEYSLKNATRISILSCDGCAKGCGTGGAVGIEVLKDLLKEWGKEVVFTQIVWYCCGEDLMRQVLTINSEAISGSEALIIHSCSSGVKAAYLCDPGVPVIGVLDSVGCAVFTQQDNLVARSICNGCGHYCVVMYTGGICPLAEYPARKKYEPCQKAPENGTQCTVNPGQDCVWKEIAKRGGLGALKDLRQIHETEEGNRFPPTMRDLGNLEGGEVLCEKALRFAREISGLYNLTMTEFEYGCLFNSKGDGRNGVEHLQNAIRYAEEAQMVSMLGVLWGRAGYGYYLMGELQTAREHAERTIKIQSDAGIPVAAFLPYWVLDMVHLDSGDLKNARNCVEEALRLAQNNNEKAGEAQSRLSLGTILGKADPSQHGKAEEYILQGIKMFNELQVKPYSSQGYLTLGELYADMGQREKALEYLEKAKGMFWEMRMDYWLCKTQSVLERLQS